MRIRSALCVSGVGLMSIASSAMAQTASGGAPSTQVEISRLEEVVVTARRREESIKDVPQTINVVSSEQLEKLNVRNLNEIQGLVPGLTLSGGGGFSTAATVRGVAFNVEASGNNPTVEFYLNDTPIASNFLFQSLFDLGQFELLRGPQGTLRGRASPSGSITLTTRRPDLSEWGAVANASISDAHAYKYDAAVNIPIINDVLAVRLAGVSDENEWTRVRTIKRAADPAHNPDSFRDTAAGRVSVRFEPVDWLALNVMYQTLEQTNAQYEQVQSASLATGEALSGALIRPSDFLSADDQGDRGRQDMDIAIWNADVRVAGQRISYSGSYNMQEFGSMGAQDAGDYFSPSRFPSAERAFQDPANNDPVCQREGRNTNLVPTNQNYYQCTFTKATRKSHELRLASEERIAGIFDYVVGGLYDDIDAPVRLTQETPLLVAPTVVGAINLTPIVREGNSEETSFFGNLTAHLSDALELSGGLRYIDYKNFSSMLVSGAAPTPAIDEQESTTIYAGSVKYRFTEDLMVYGTIGSSWRPSVHVIGNFSANLTPRERSFIDLAPEESTSYEAGLKTSFLEERGSFNLSVFHQEFDNYVYRDENVYFVNYRRLTPTVVVPEVGAFSFVAGVPATVDGAEAEVSFQINPLWRVTGNVSYADGQVENGTIACTDLNGDGVPDVNVAPPTLAQLTAAVGAGQNVSQCQFSGRATFVPEWTANLQTDASFELTSRFDGFVRALATYSPANAQNPNNAFDNVDGYALVNFYTGLRAPDGSWEISLFANNVFDERVVLGSGSSPQTTNLTALRFGPGGSVIGSTASSFSSPYYSVSALPEREVGIALRVGFGSR